MILLICMVKPSILIFITSLLLSISLYAQTISEIPTDKILSGLELEETAKNLSEDLKERLQKNLRETKIVDNLKNKVIDASLGDYVELTRDEKKLLNRIGMPKEEIDSIDLLNNPEEGQEKITKSINNFVEDEKKEAKNMAMQSAIPGLGSSIIGLTFSAFLGPLVLIKCRTQPSALVFGGTSIAWIGLEMMSWNNYKFEYEKLTKLGDVKGITKDGKKLSSKVIRLYEEIKQDVESSVESSEMDSFDTAKVAIDKNLSSAQGKIEELRVAVKEFQVEFQKFSDTQISTLETLKKSIVLIKDNTKIKSRNATFAAIGFATASGLAFAEQFNMIGPPGGKCLAPNTSERSSNNRLLDAFNWIIPSAHADMKKTAMANFDKIGIPIGAGLLVAYLAFKAKFLNPIYASGTSRGITFGVMAAIAGIAAWKMKKFVKYLEEKIEILEELIITLKRRLDKTEDLLSRADKFMDFVGSVIIPQAKNFLEQADSLVKETENMISENEVLKEQVENKINDLKEEYGDDIDSLQNKLKDINLDETLPTQSSPSIKLPDDLPEETDDLIQDLKEEGEKAIQSKRSSFIEIILDKVMYNAIGSNERVDGFCLTGIKNIQLDKGCRCRRNNRCSQLKLKVGNIKKNKITKGLLSNSSQVLMGLKYLSHGMGNKAQSIFERLSSQKQNTDNINKYFYQKLKKNNITPESIEKRAQRELNKLNKLGNSSLPLIKRVANSPYMGNRSKRPPSSNKEASQRALNRLKNILSLKLYLDGKDDPFLERIALPKINNQKMLNSLKDIETDKSRDLFKMINRRYMKVFQN